MNKKLVKRIGLLLIISVSLLCELAAAVNFNPVPGGGVRRLTEFKPDHPNFDPDVENVFYTCQENGWEIAPSYIAFDGKDSNPAAFSRLVRRAATFISVIGASHLRSCAALVFPPAVAACAAVRSAEITANSVKFAQFVDDHGSLRVTPVYADEPFSGTRRVLDKINVVAAIIQFKFSTRDIPVMENFVGILQNLETSSGPEFSNKDDNLQRAVSNSAHSLCHLIRCGRDLATKQDDWILADPQQGDICRVYDDLTQDRSPSPHFFQDLKNYFALDYLREATVKVTKKVQPTPFMELMMLHNMADQVLDPVNLETADAMDEGFFSRTYGNLQSNGGDEFLLRRRLSRLCSEVEFSLCAPVNLRFSRITLDNGFPDVSQANHALMYPNDLMASTLLNENKYSNGYLKYVAFESMNNLVALTPLPLLSADMIFSRGNDKLNPKKNFAFIDGGDKHLAAKYRLTAHTSLSQESLQQMYIKRTAWLTNSDKGITLEQEMSQLGILENEVKRRLTQPEWYEQMSVAGDEVILKDLATVLSLQLKVKSDMRQHLERIETLMASNLGLTFNETVGASEKARIQAESLQ